MLTRRQKQILEYIKKHIKENDYPPSLEEIGRYFKLSSLATVHQHIEALKVKGYLKDEPRTIQISENKTLTVETLVTPFINSYNEIIVDEDSNKFITYETMGCSIILLIFSVIALLGAVASLKRKNIDVAVAGALLGIFSFGFFMLGSILSIISLFIILRSKEEFENGKKGKSF